MKIKNVILISLCVVIAACSEDKSLPVTDSGLTRDEVMKMAEANLRGEVSDEELKENGISLGEAVKGDDAKEMLIKEFEALDEEEANSK